MKLDRKSMIKLMILIAFGVILFVGLSNLGSIAAFGGWVLKMATPFTVGLCIAFIINVPLKGIEKHLGKIKCFKDGKRAKLLRAVCLILTFVLVFGFIIAVMFIVIPEFARTLTSLADRIPGFYNRFMQFLASIEDEYPQIVKYINEININWDEINAALINWLQSTAIRLASSTFTTATAAVSFIFNFFIGIIFACYVLIQKEKLGNQVKRAMFAFLPEKKTKNILRICTLTSDTFSGFLSGQCIEACILGTMVFITLTIFRFPYAFTISVLIGFMALIPIFGAIISCVIGAFMVLVIDPVMAVWFVVIILVIQQIESNLIYPHVVGSTVGLPSIWVLISVVLGGNLLGVFGMLTAVPVSSVLYTLFRETVNNKLKQRRIKEV